MSDDQRQRPTGEPTRDYAPAPYAPQQGSGASGWLIGLGVVTVLALGGIAAGAHLHGRLGQLECDQPDRDGQ